MAVAHTHSDIELLRRRLDRAVAAASVIRILGWCGRVACIAAVAGAIVAAMNMAFGPLAPGITRLAVIGLTICGAVVAWRLHADPPPRRFDVAVAAEAAAPRLGERLSRAVEFLDEATADGTGGMKQLALDDAAAAAATLARLPVPGMQSHARWLAAGCAAIACVVATAAWWPRPGIATGAGRDSGPRTAADQRSPDAGRLAPVAASIAAAAAIEMRLAESLGDRFATSPGVVADDLPAAEARDLDRLARMHEQLAQEIGRGRDAVAALAATEPAARAALSNLDMIDATRLDQATAAIASHRLGIATQIVTQTAAALTAAARDLGWAGSLPDKRAAALPADAPPASRQLAATLAEIDDRPQAASARAVGVDPSLRPTVAPEVAPSLPAGAAPAPGDADTTGVATTEPRFGTGGGPQEVATTSPAAGPVTRAWNRLPARVRPVLPRGAEPDVPPAYRRAVDLYYKSLVDALRADPTIPAPQPRP